MPICWHKLERSRREIDERLLQPPMKEFTRSRVNPRNMANSNDRNVNALGEPVWVDVLKGIRTFLVLLALVAVVGGGLGIAIIAPWGRASPDCSIFCVIVNKLKDPIQWSELESKSLTKEMISDVEKEMSYLSFSFDMPNYKQHRVSLNKEQYENLIKGINSPIEEIKHTVTGIELSIIEELYLKIKSKEYKNIDDRYSKAEKLNVFKRVFEQRKDIVLAKLYGIKRPEYELAAEQGDANAQYNMALLYQAGKSVPKDPQMAEKWYIRAAVQGDVRAQYNLARMYYDGQGLPQNFGAALRWFTKAAEYGHAHAQHSLGLMYFKGQGVPADKNTANKWWKRASRQGYSVDDKPTSTDKPK